MPEMERHLKPYLLQDLGSKILLISGPRQCGKTTLALSLSEDCVYLNWDDISHRNIIAARSWDKAPRVVIFDELHKMPKWKAWLKGLYDTHKNQAYIVTGSARLDTFRKVGDSLAGRFFSFHLHPIDVKEGVHQASLSMEAAARRILEVSGFPEPFLKGETRFYRRWAASHLDIILRQDLIDLETVANIQGINLLIALLQQRVGSPVSVHSLARDMQVSDKTVRRWLGLLEELYVIFRVSPYHRNIARSLLKAAKYYFYDVAKVESGEGARFENMVACALLKEVDFRNDCLGERRGLCYLRDRDGREVDFLVTLDAKPSLLIEAKLGEESPAGAFKHFAPGLAGAAALQLVYAMDKPRSHSSGIKILPAAKWLSEMSF